VAVDLLFSEGHPAPGPIDLVFGRLNPGPGSASATAAIDLSVYTFVDGVGITGLIEFATAAIELLDVPVVVAAGNYDSAVYRGPRLSMHQPWQQAASTRIGTSTSWEGATTLDASVRMPIIDAVPLRAASVASVWDSAASMPRQATTLWQDAMPLRLATTRVDATEALMRRSQATTRWQEGLTADPRPTVMAFEEATRLRMQRTTRFEEATPASREIRSTAHDAAGLVRSWVVPWDEAKLPGIGKSVVAPVVPPIDLCYTPADGNAVPLVFTRAWSDSTTLTFVCDNHPTPPVPPADVTVPIREVYMISNTTSLTLTDGTDIPCTEFTLTLDYQSWTWGFSAVVPFRMRPQLGVDTAGQPVQLLAHVNGQDFLVFVQSASSQRQFPVGSMTVTGVGVISTLDAPYSPTMTFTNTADQNAQQIANSVLTDNGVSIGWAVDWGLTDWLVPANAWSFQGTYATALQAIAAAAGGYLQPHPTDLTVRLLPLYPTMPWTWDTITPDFELPSAVVQVEGIQWSSLPLYNTVFVTGANSGGVVCHVTRTGTAGDLEATQVTDQLITAAEAGQQRGASILANVGQQALVGLTLPVLTETGVILPGKMVRYVDAEYGITRTGIVRSLSLAVKYPAVYQTIGVETHVG
jgi:hypothetical protein